MDGDWEAGAAAEAGGAPPAGCGAAPPTGPLGEAGPLIAPAFGVGAGGAPPRRFTPDAGDGAVGAPEAGAIPAGGGAPAPGAAAGAPLVGGFFGREKLLCFCRMEPVGGGGGTTALLRGAAPVLMDAEVSVCMV